MASQPHNHALLAIGGRYASMPSSTLGQEAGDATNLECSDTPPPPPCAPNKSTPPRNYARNTPADPMVRPMNSTPVQHSPWPPNRKSQREFGTEDFAFVCDLKEGYFGKVLRRRAVQSSDRKVNLFLAKHSSVGTGMGTESPMGGTDAEYKMPSIMTRHQHLYLNLGTTST